MKAKEMIAAAMKKQRVTQKNLAEYFGKSKQCISSMLSRDRITADNFLDVMSVLGYEVRFYDRNGCEAVRRYGKPTRQMVDGVIYDTEKSVFVCGNFYHDGGGKYKDGMAFEVFRSIEPEDRYFIVNYEEWNNENGRVSVIDKQSAVTLFEKYGAEERRKEVFGDAKA